jgi:transposase
MIPDTVNITDILNKEYAPEQAAKIRSRYQAIMDVNNGCKVSDICRKYGIDRTSFYKWKNRFAVSGIQGLADLPSVHHTHPQTTGDDTIEKIIRMALDPGIEDCMMISEKLKLLYGIKLSHVTVNKYLKKFSLHTNELRSYSADFVSQHVNIKKTSIERIKEVLNQRVARLTPCLIKDIQLNKDKFIRINITTPPEGLSSFHIREWYMAEWDTNGCKVYKPSKKGISFPVHQVDELVDVMKKIEKNIMCQDSCRLKLTEYDHELQ